MLEASRKAINTSLFPKIAKRSWFTLQAGIMLYAQLALLNVSHRLVIPTNGFAATRPWVRYVVAGYSIYIIAFTFFMRKLLKPAMDQVEEAGRDREFGEFLMLSACAISPGLLAFFFFALGGPAADFHLWCAASIILQSYWMWVYRHRFLNEKIE